MDEKTCENCGYPLEEWEEICPICDPEVEELDPESIWKELEI